ncbi:YciI family protein, partial [Acidithiobacillus ferrooxidans]
DSLEDAHTWAAAEPYLSAGVYADVSVRPYKGVFLP